MSTTEADGLVSRFMGLVEYVHPMSFTPDSIADTLYSGKTADAGDRVGAASDAFSMGPGASADGGRRACVGEAVERFSIFLSRKWSRRRLCSAWSASHPPRRFSSA